MVRSLLAVVAGIGLAWAGIAFIESVGHGLYPPPEGIDPADREAFAAAVQEMPRAALVVVLLAWSVGTFCGAWLAARLAGRHFYAMLVGGVMMLGGVANLVAIPHPLWFSAVGTLVFLPAAHLGGRLAAPPP